MVWRHPEHITCQGNTLRGWGALQPGRGAKNIWQSAQLHISVALLCFVFHKTTQQHHESRWTDLYSSKLETPGSYASTAPGASLLHLTCKFRVTTWQRLLSMFLIIGTHCPLGFRILFPPFFWLIFYWFSWSLYTPILLRPWTHIFPKEGVTWI